MEELTSKRKKQFLEAQEKKKLRRAKLDSLRCSCGKPLRENVGGLISASIRCNECRQRERKQTPRIID